MNLKTFKQARREHALATLNHFKWNVDKAAFALGITQASMYKVIHKDPVIEAEFNKSKGMYIKSRLHKPIDPRLNDLRYDGEGRN